MSESETQKLVETYLAALNQADATGMLACLSEDVAHDINEGGRGDRQGCLSPVPGDDGPPNYREELSDHRLSLVGRPAARAAAAEFTGARHLSRHRRKGCRKPMASANHAAGRHLSSTSTTTRFRASPPTTIWKPGRSKWRRAG